MRILTFDTESSTGCTNDGSLCSLGYYNCDENFRPIEQRDIVINPLARFRYQIIGKNRKVDLAYSLAEFRSAPRFNEKYQEIKDLFNSCDFVVGFAVENDVKYLRDACDKFELEQITYKFIDVKQLLELFGDEYKDKGLGSIAEGLGVEFIAHRSDEDARVTALVLKYLCDKHKLSVLKLIEFAGVVFGENKKESFSHSYSLSQLYQKNGFIRTGRQTNALLDHAEKVAFKSYVKGGTLSKKSVAIAKCIKFENIDNTFGLLQKIYSLSAKYAPCVQVANLYVYRDGADDKEYERAKELIASGKRLKLVEEKAFYKMIDGYAPKTFDYLSVIKKYDDNRTAKRLVAKSKQKPVQKKLDKQKNDA